MAMFNCIMTDPNQPSLIGKIYVVEDTKFDFYIVKYGVSDIVNKSSVTLISNDEYNNIKEQKLAKIDTYDSEEFAYRKDAIYRNEFLINILKQIECFDRSGMNRINIAPRIYDYIIENVDSMGIIHQVFSKLNEIKFDGGYKVLSVFTGNRTKEALLAHLLRIDKEEIVLKYMEPSRDKYVKALSLTGVKNEFYVLNSSFLTLEEKLEIIYDIVYGEQIFVRSAKLDDILKTLNDDTKNLIETHFGAFVNAKRVLSKLAGQ